jgi:hypothetical protein
MSRFLLNICMNNQSEIKNFTSCQYNQIAFYKLLDQAEERKAEGVTVKNKIYVLYVNKC